MLKAICYGLVSLIAGGLAAAYIPAWGAVVSVSIIGVGIISSLENKES